MGFRDVFEQDGAEVAQVFRAVFAPLGGGVSDRYEPTPKNFGAKPEKLFAG